MTDSVGRHNTDVFGCIANLEEALAQPELEDFNPGGVVTPHSQRAASELAIALGKCRLFKAQLPKSLDVVLPAMVAAAAAEGTCVLLDEMSKVALSLEETFDADPEEAEEDVFQLLEARMDILAAHTAVEETYVAHSQKSSLPAQQLAILTDAFDKFLTRVEAFDVALRRKADFLAFATESRLLDNWRSAMGILGATELPWWLDGTLERQAEVIQQEAKALGPSASGQAAVQEQPDDASKPGGEVGGLPTGTPGTVPLSEPLGERVIRIAHRIAKEFVQQELPKVSQRFEDLWRIAVQAARDSRWQEGKRVSAPGNLAMVALSGLPDVDFAAGAAASILIVGVVRDFALSGPPVAEAVRGTVHRYAERLGLGQRWEGRLAVMISDGIHRDMGEEPQ